MKACSQRRLLVVGSPGAFAFRHRRQLLARRQGRRRIRLALGLRARVRYEKYEGKATARAEAARRNHTPRSFM